MMFGTHVLNTADFEENIDFLKEAGITTLVFGFSAPLNIIWKSCEHFEVFLEFQPFGAGGVQDYLVENVSAERKDLGALGCPSNKELRDTNLLKLERRLSEVNVDGVVLDFVRFPSPADGAFFYSCFCKSCGNAAKSFGFDIDAIKNNLKQFLKKPEFELLADWLDLKKEFISNYAKEFSERIKTKKGAFLFSPSLSSLVGQDYRGLSSYLDKTHPMLYPEGGLGPACVGYEIFFLASGTKQELPKMYKYLGCENPGNPLTLESLRLNGMPDEIITSEARKAVGLSKAEVQPIVTILSIPPERAAKRVQLTLSETSSLLLFGFEDRQSLMFLKELKA